MNVEDINRITGIDNESDEFNKEVHSVEEEGTYYDGKKWISLEIGDSMNVEDSNYVYNLKVIT